MRIAIAKPQYSEEGGFERVLKRVEAALEDRGHSVDWLRVRMPAPEALPPPFGVGVPHAVVLEHPAFFVYMAMIDAFERLDTSRYDLVISTQPPSFAVHHPRHLSLFYHHERVYYDLFDDYVDSGHVDRDLHTRARDIVRAVDATHLKRVTRFLAGGEVVAERLRDFSGFTGNVTVWNVGPAVTAPDPPAEPAGATVLCIGRCAPGKRTEMFVHAMKYLPDMHGTVVGNGVRLRYTELIDAQLSMPGADLDAVDDRALWLNQAVLSKLRSPRPRSNIRFTGRVPDPDLLEIYQQGFCVVAPSRNEDYGLVAIEAMSHGLPVIVCRDGGGLTRIVEDGETGLVVEPSGRAIAEAVRRLAGDPAEARRMGERGREVARRYSWEGAVRTLLDAVDEVAAA